METLHYIGVLLKVRKEMAIHSNTFSLGFPEIVFLLLNAGLDPKQKDSYAQVFNYDIFTTLLFTILP